MRLVVEPFPRICRYFDHKLTNTFMGATLNQSREGLFHPENRVYNLRRLRRKIITFKTASLMKELLVRRKGIVIAYPTGLEVLFNPTLADLMKVRLGRKRRNYEVGLFASRNVALQEVIQDSVNVDLGGSDELINFLNPERCWPNQSGEPNT